MISIQRIAPVSNPSTHAAVSIPSGSALDAFESVRARPAVALNLFGAHLVGADPIGSPAPLVDPAHVRDFYSGINFQDDDPIDPNQLDPEIDFPKLDPALVKQLQTTMADPAYGAPARVYAFNVDGQPTYVVIGTPVNSTMNADGGIPLKVFDAHGTLEASAHPNGQTFGFAWDV